MSFLSLFGSDSQSSSSTSQTTNTTDQRVGADNAGIAVGANASYINQLPTQTADIFKSAFDFSSGVINKVVAVTDSAVLNQAQTAQNIVASQAQYQAQATLGNASIISQNIPLIVVAAAAVAVFFFMRKH